MEGMRESSEQTRVSGTLVARGRDVLQRSPAVSLMHPHNLFTLHHCKCNTEAADTLFTSALLGCTYRDPIINFVLFDYVITLV